jgi:dolichol-phosphate mannosyltransferase
MDERVMFSIVVPAFNEPECLPEFHRRLAATMEAHGEPWELVVVDDGSTDATPLVLSALATRDPRVRPITLARNFGHQIALTAGFDASRGEAVVAIDADLQDPPEVIPALIRRWRDGFDVVSAVRTDRDGENRFKKATAAIFYRLIHRLADVDIQVDAGDFRLLDRQVVDVLNGMRERHRFLRGMSAWAGFSQTTVPYRRAARFAGTTKYPLRKMLRLAVNAVTGFSYAPLQLATLLGFVAAGLSLIAIPVALGLRLSGAPGLGGQTTTLIPVLFLGGVQLISLGVLGEYVGRVYDEVKGRPLYVLRKPGGARPDRAHREVRVTAGGR